MGLKPPTTSRKARLIAAFGVVIIRSLNATLRIRFIDHAGVFAEPPKPGQIWVFWHNRLILIPRLRERYFPTRAVGALTSASRDGDLLAAFLERFRIRPVRGSSSRRGAAALREMKGIIDGGCDMALTPDGPRGPRYHLHSGVIALAQQTERTIIPIGVEFSSCWRMGRWDGFMLPKPFARAVVTFGRPIAVKATTTTEEFESERIRIEEALMSLTTLR